MFKKFGKNKKVNQFLAFAGSFTFIFFVASTNLVFAANNGSGNAWIGLITLISNPVGAQVVPMINASAGWIFSLLIQGVAHLGALVLAFLATCLNYVMVLSEQALNLEAVRVGWTTVLSITNAGFVIGIIIIAFATIFRWSSYHMKNILWKLVFAAVIVNFSLVICSALLSLSNTVANVFLSKTSYSDVSTALMNATNPQSFLGINTGNITNGANKGFWESIGDNITGFLKEYDPTQGISAIMDFVVNFFFISTFVSLTVIVFAMIFIMMLLRLVHVIFLVIISPMVWLFWVFPGTKKYFSSWWQDFIKWLVFAPVVSFFIYLTVLMANGMGNINAKVFNGNSGPAQIATNGLEVLGENFALKAINLIIILGMLVGGLIASEKIGGKTGAMGVQWAKSGGKWAGRQLGRGATAPLRTKGGKDFVSGMQKVGSNYDRTKFWGKVGTWATGGVREAGNRLSLAGGGVSKDLIKRSEKKIGEMSYQDLANNFATANTATQIAIAQKLMKDGKLNMLSDDDIRKVTGNPDTATNFEKLGSKHVYDDYTKKTLGDKSVVDAEEKTAKIKGNIAIIDKEINKLKEISATRSLTAEEDAHRQDLDKVREALVMGQVKADDELVKSYENFYKSFSPKDYANIRTKTLLEGSAAGSRLGALLEANPSTVSSVMSKFSGKDFDNFIKVFKGSGVFTNDDLILPNPVDTPAYKDLSRRAAVAGIKKKTKENLEAKMDELVQDHKDTEDAISGLADVQKASDEQLYAMIKFHKAAQIDKHKKAFNVIEKPLATRLSEGGGSND